MVYRQIRIGFEISLNLWSFFLLLLGSCRRPTWRAGVLLTGPPLQVTSIFEHCALAQRSGTSKPCFESRCGLKSMIFMIFDFWSYFGHVHGKPSRSHISADILNQDLSLCKINALRYSSQPCFNGLSTN